MSKKVFIGVIVVFIIILIFSIGGLLNTPSTQENSALQNKPRQEKTLAYMLAEIELQKTNPPQALVNQFDDLLNSLQKKCKENDRELLSDIIVKSKEIVEEEGGKTTLLNFAKNLEESIPEELMPANCRDMAAVLIGMMVSEK